MVSKYKKFKDIKVNEYFGGWGDELSNYDYPKWCLFQKDDKNGAIEIDSNGNKGIGILMNENCEVTFYGNEIPKND